MRIDDIKPGQIWRNTLNNWGALFLDTFTIEQESTE